MEIPGHLETAEFTDKGTIPPVEWEHKDKRTDGLVMTVGTKEKLQALIGYIIGKKKTLPWKGKFV